MLPEIEFTIAQILDNMGKSQESRARIEALIPYMRLIGRSQMADLAQEYVEYMDDPKLRNAAAGRHEKDGRENQVFIFH